MSRLFTTAVYNQEGQDIVLQSKIKLRDFLIEKASNIFEPETKMEK